MSTFRVYLRTLLHTIRLALVLVGIPALLIWGGESLGSAFGGVAVLLLYAAFAYFMAGVMLAASYELDAVHVSWIQLARRLRSSIGVRLFLANLVTGLLMIAALVPGLVIKAIRFEAPSAAVSTAEGLAWTVSIAIFLYIMTSLALTGPVVVVEAKSLRKAIRRSWSLAGGRRWWLLGALAISGFVFWIAFSMLVIFFMKLGASTRYADVVSIVLGYVLIFLPILSILVVVLYRAVLAQAEFRDVVDVDAVP